MKRVRNAKVGAAVAVDVHTVAAVVVVAGAGAVEAADAAAVVAVIEATAADTVATGSFSS
jgi:hypothetical protein